MRQTAIVASLGMIMAAAHAASGAVFITFQDPANGREVLYSAPTEGGAMGQLSVTADVSLQFDLTSIGLGVISVPNVHYTKTGQVGSVTVLPDGDFVAEVYNGHFEYRDASNALILSGDFGTGLSSGPNGGNLVISGPSGSIITNNSPLRGGLTYTFGTAVVPGTGGLSLPDYLLAANYQFGAAVDGNWTLTAVTPLPQLLESGFLASFDGNAAFTGTIDVVQVPAPGSAALVLGPVSLLRLRRRRN